MRFLSFVALHRHNETLLWQNWICCHRFQTGVDRKVAPTREILRDGFLLSNRAVRGRVKQGKQI
jgi:hypothetical protein